jgi:hypothetical protein
LILNSPTGLEEEVMAQIKSLVHLTSRSFVVTFPEDVSPTDATDRTKWHIVGADHNTLPIESILPAHPPAPIMPAYPPYPGEILPAYPPISIRDYLVFTGLPTNQPYNLTVVGLTSPDGTLFPPFTWSWTPLQPPTAYPSDGIMKPSVDGDSVGSRIQIAIPPVPRTGSSTSRASGLTTPNIRSRETRTTVGIGS